MKSQITCIRRIVDENELIRGYELVVETDEMPDLKLGDCEIKQK